MLAALLLSLQIPSYGLPPDALLDKPLAIEARIEPLPELLARVGKELGTKLTVEKRMEGLKATVFTPARPARLTLAGLASVFDAEWAVRRSGGYELAETVPARNRREAHLRLEDAERRAPVETFLQGDGPRSVYLPSDDDGRVARMPSGFAGAEAGVRRLWRTLNELDRAQFWRGETMHQIGMDEGAEGTPVETVRDAAGKVRYSTWTPERAPGRTLLLVRSRSDEGGLRFAFLGATSTGSTWTALLGSDKMRDVERSSFRKAQDAWVMNVKASTAPELDRPLKQFEAVKPLWAKERRTESDLLQMLHRASGIPIVAEAFRVIASTKIVPSQGTLRDAMWAVGLGGRSHFENGTLLMRPEAFWRLRTGEPAEKALASFENADSDDPIGVFDAAATTFGELSYAAILVVGRSAARKDLRELEEGRWALRLWGSMTTEERKQALGKEGIPLEAMSSKTRSALREATLETIFSGRSRILTNADISKIDERNQSVEIALGLLGLAPFAPLSLWAERGVSEQPKSRSANVVHHAPEARTGFSAFIGDREGRGLRLFAPQPSGK